MKIVRIELDSCNNTRDLGGFHTMDGGQILPYRLIRSGSLYGISRNDAAKLIKQYNLGTIVDFRTKAEQINKPDPLFDNIKYISNPILNEKTVGITHENSNPKKESYSEYINLVSSLTTTPAEYMSNLYQTLILDSHAMKQFSRFFNIIISSDNKAILWHCSVGKDRAGIGTALLLSALGVNKSIILEDFIKTNEFVASEVTAITDHINLRYQNSSIASAIKVLLTVSKTYLLDSFNAIEMNYGNMHNYLLKGLELTSSKIDILKGRFLRY